MNPAQKIFDDALNGTRARNLAGTIDDMLSICGRIAADQEITLSKLILQGRTAEAAVAELALERMDQMYRVMMDVREAAQ